MINRAETVACECGHPDCPGGVPVPPPFKLHFEALSDDLADMLMYVSVRTSSWEFDGERTDLHDVLSLLLAAAFRARDIASARLITELNGFSGIDSEIYARLLILDQEGSLNAECSPRKRAECLASVFYDVHQVLTEAFGVDFCAGAPNADVMCSPEPDWVAKVRRRHRLRRDRGYEVRLRTQPSWSYFGSNLRGIMALQLPEEAADQLRNGLAFEAQTVPGIGAQLYRSRDLLNAPSSAALDELVWLIACVDNAASKPLVIPTDSHLIGIGQRSIAAVRTYAGRESFHQAADDLRARRESEAAFLYDGCLCVWAANLNDARFESMVQELVAKETGVSRVRQVGATREQDDGRDLIADWNVVADRGGEFRGYGGQIPFIQPRQVLVQVKVRGKGVGRSDVPNLRDTLDHYQCDGLLLVAYPRVTVPLMDHLAEMRRRGRWWVEWWGLPELETRLRRHPEIARRYPDLIELRENIL